MSIRSLLAACLLPLVMAGCGGQQEPAAAPSGAPAAPPAENTTAQQTTTAPSETPAQVVHRFLEAIRVGDDQLAESLLTPLALEKTREFEIAVAPPGSATAAFTVGQVELVQEGLGAHVASSWTDVDETGEQHADNLVWFLRLEDHGWRVAGMAARLFPEEPPLFLNFEDPEDMIRKQEMAAQEVQRRIMEAEAAYQQQQPETELEQPVERSAEQPVGRQSPLR